MQDVQHGQFGAIAAEPLPRLRIAMPRNWGRRVMTTSRAERDVIALGIISAAILLFVGTGSQVLTRLVRHALFGEASADMLLTNALVLNIALIIFGWRRYTDLTREVAARREAEAAALRLADSDPLTGLLNRRSFGAALTRLAVASAQQGQLAVILIDLDRFKQANDAHGHQAGDAVLVETARRVRAVLPASAALARLGGDEFAAAIPIARDAHGALDTLAERIGQAIAQPVSCGEHTVMVTASIGVACDAGIALTIPADAAPTLMHHADVAMYQAKKAGRSRHCWYDPAMEQDMIARGRLEQAIREGLAKGEFRPFYEKQIDLASGAITGLEMLARWHSPERGLVGPDLFLAVAEEIGLMPELSEALIRQALADARDWAPHLTLAINISPVQLRDPWFAQRLLKLLVEARIPAHRLDIEITEDCLAENLAVVRSLITSLRNQGVRISLDDFGHSASSLAHLRALPFDRIKIDRNFIAGLGHSRDSVAMVEAISALGRGMDLPLTAEGIESAEILDELRKLGGFQGQGYIYGRPMSAADLHDELATCRLLADDRDAPVTQRDSRTA
jgi:diguanylate cyclase (GGDEF)-like protein